AAGFGHDHADLASTLARKELVKVGSRLYHHGRLVAQGEIALQGLVVSGAHLDRHDGFVPVIRLSNRVSQRERREQADECQGDPCRETFAHDPLSWFRASRHGRHACNRSNKSASADPQWIQSVNGTIPYAYLPKCHRRGKQMSASGRNIACSHQLTS